MRDAAFLAVAEGTAARNEEIRHLTLADVEYTSATSAIITIQHGKGDKPRQVDLFDEHLRRLTAWIEARGVAGEYVFTRIHRGGVISHKHPITYEGTRGILYKRFTASALADGMTWHDFRRTAIGRMFDMGEDESTIMTITGHENVEMLHRYDRRPADRRQELLRKIQSQTFDEG